MNQQNLLFIKVDKNMFKSTEKIDGFNLVRGIKLCGFGDCGGAGEGCLQDGGNL